MNEAKEQGNRTTGWIEVRDGGEFPEYGQAVRCVRYGYQEVVVFRCFKGMPPTWEQHNGFRVHGVTHWKHLDWPPSLTSEVTFVSPSSPSPVVTSEIKTAVGRPRIDFWGWWNRDGRFYDPDTEDVPWFDKRKFLAERAFDAGVAQGSNYVADKEKYPLLIGFANGRVVSIRYDENQRPYLEVEREEQLAISVAESPVVQSAGEKK